MTTQTTPEPTETTPDTILSEEHAAISMVLDDLDRAITALEHGHPVDASLFRDLDEFFTLFVGRCHHGKEEQILFPTLDRSPEGLALVRHLERDHERGVELAAAYSVATDEYAARGLAAAGPLIAAARAYAAALRRHIAEENDDLLPRAAATVSSAQRQDLVAAFERYEEEVMGAGTHERLHRMIDTLGPRLAACGA